MKHNSTRDAACKRENVGDETIYGLEAPRHEGDRVVQRLQMLRHLQLDICDEIRELVVSRRLGSV